MSCSCRSRYIVRELQNEPLRSDSSSSTLRIFDIQMIFTLNVSFCKGFHQRTGWHNLRYMTAPSVEILSATVIPPAFQEAVRP
jgi:hypothetical protein